MELRQLITLLEAKKVEFLLVGDAVKYRAPLNSLTEGERNSLWNAREGIASFVRARHASLQLKFVEVRDAAPQASHSQEMWWRAYGGENEGKPVPLNIPITVLFENTNSKQVCAAIKTIIHANPVLRSRFLFHPPPVQADVFPIDSFKIDVHDLASLSYPTSFETAKNHLPSFFQQIIPMENNWLVKAKVINLGSGFVLAAISMNHIISDGTSRTIIVSQLKSLIAGTYRRIVHPISFFDYSQHERQILGSKDGKELEGYWEQWAKLLPILRHPISGIPLHWKSGTRNRYNFVFASPTVTRIHETARYNSVSPFVVYMTILSIAIARWSGSQSFAVRALGDKRMSQDLFEIVGLMYCADAIKAFIPEGDTFSSNLRRIQDEYQSSLTMRLPTVQFFPPFMAGPHNYRKDWLNEIPAAINYYSTSRSVSTVMDDTIAIWPPKVDRKADQIWTRPISPIFLQLGESHSTVDAEIQFNEAIMSNEDQKKFIELFLEVLEQNELTA